MAVSWCSEADEALQQFMSDACRDIDYVVFTLEGKNQMVIQPGHLGKGGRAKVEEILSDASHASQVMNGAFLALAVDERGTVVSTRRKYIHFTWVGPSVSFMVKGRVNSMSGSFRQRFPGCAIYLQLMGDLDDLGEKTLEKNLLAAGGAHKPSRYDFTNAALDGTQIGGSNTANTTVSPTSSPSKATIFPTISAPAAASSIATKPVYEKASAVAEVAVTSPIVVESPVKAEEPVVMEIAAKKSDAEAAPEPEVAEPSKESEPPLEFTPATVEESASEPATEPDAVPEPTAEPEIIKEIDVEEPVILDVVAAEITPTSEPDSVVEPEPVTMETGPAVEEATEPIVPQELAVESSSLDDVPSTEETAVVPEESSDEPVVVEVAA